MPVTVRISRVFQGEHLKRVHPSADGIVVTEGHLHATRWNGAANETVAVYAPGQWIDATTEQPDEKP